MGTVSGVERRGSESRSDRDTQRDDGRIGIKVEDWKIVSISEGSELHTSGSELRTGLIQVFP
eukprot:13437218-Alexandrium_andersonii.AAC.1